VWDDTSRYDTDELVFPEGPVNEEFVGAIHENIFQYSFIPSCNDSAISASDVTGLPLLTPLSVVQ
jgi:hypothetical protein